MRGSCLILGLFCVCSMASGAAAQTLRFETTVRGGLAITGNSLGLAKSSDNNGPGTEDSIGTFMAADGASVDDQPASLGSPWPAGTTSSWLANGSSAELDLPAGSTVLYAELIWGGSWDYFEDVRAFLDDAVSLSHEGGASTSASPDPATSMTIQQTGPTGFPVNYYMRSAEVTDFVKNHGGGAYTLGGVPGTQHEAINSFNAAGWTLVVAWRHPEASVRFLAIVVGGGWVDEGSSVTVDLAGFETPARDARGLLLSSAIEGDANLDGDYLSFDGGAGAVTLSGPNNPANNFFASQLNDIDGSLDTRGSFGDRNHDAASSINTVGGRQGWDRTAVALWDREGHFTRGSQAATVEARSDGDGYVLVLTALEVDTVPEPSKTTLGVFAAAALVAVARLERRGRRNGKVGLPA